MKIKNDEYKQLLDECFGLLSERKFDLSIRDLEWRHELGGLIINSDLYKNSDNKTDLVKKIARDLSVSAPLLYQCIEFTRKFPDFNKFISEFKPEQKSLKWSDVRLLLVENPSSCPHNETYTEVVEISRIKCSKCGKTLEEVKNKINKNDI